MANAWLRLWHDMPNDPKWRTIARVSGQPIATVMAVYIHLLVSASRNVTHMSRRVTTDKDTDKDKDKAIDKEKDAGTAKSVVRSLGTHKNIMLTSEQYNELESRCRSVGLSLESYISKLSQWLFTKGRHCTDPYRIISGWLDNDSKRKTAAKPKERQGCDLSWYDDYAMNFDLSKFF